MDSRLRGNDKVNLFAAYMNDSEQPELTPANDNPWYWLATLYGEQTRDGIDQELAKKNRIAWNCWVADTLSEAQRASIDGGR